MTTPEFMERLERTRGAVRSRYQAVHNEIAMLEAVAEMLPVGAPEVSLEVGDRTLEGSGGLLTCVLQMESTDIRQGGPIYAVTENWVVRTGPYRCTIRGAPLSEIRAFAAMVPAFLELLEKTIREEAAT